jgi:hypothetical protein
MHALDPGASQQRAQRLLLADSLNHGGVDVGRKPSRDASDGLARPPQVLDMHAPTLAPLLMAQRRHLARARRERLVIVEFGVDRSTGRWNITLHSTQATNSVT